MLFSLTQSAIDTFPATLLKQKDSQTHMNTHEHMHTHNTHIYTSEMIHHHGASLSKQQTAALLICHGTQQDLSLSTVEAKLDNAQVAKSQR